MYSPSGTAERGFTLIELSIVLVVIGLIVGGVLVGQDLIRAAGVRATITQIEKYNTAANTFRSKYGYLPGDIKDPDASSFGLQARGVGAGQGDGNGVIEGNAYADAVHNSGQNEVVGETVVFWNDLSGAHLIEGTFSTSSSNAFIGYPSLTASPYLTSFFPSAKLGQGNFIYVWSAQSTNYFGLSVITAAGSPRSYGSWNHSATSL